MTRWPVWVVSVAAMAILSSCAGSDGQAPEVQIASGRLSGVVLDGVRAFKGIPYAAAPTGELRWRPPQPVSAWQGTRAGIEFGPFCPQRPPSADWFVLGNVDEGCLTLNVWTPTASPEAKQPVIVWIHGGGYQNGSGNLARLNSPALAQQGVVVVTVNYRLNIFGFFAHPALSKAQQGEPLGNYGLMDLVAALTWVQQNIGSFGGDPDNVTIAGQSAGAGLINYLMVMPAARGLFHRAISQSAAVGLTPDMRIDRRSGFHPAAEQLGVKLAERAGIEDGPHVVATLRALSADELVAAIDKTVRYSPMIEGELLTDHIGVLFAEGKQSAVPYLTGGTNWEASLGYQISKNTGGAFSPEFTARLVKAEDKTRLYGGLDPAEQADQIFGDLFVLSSARYLANQMNNVGAPSYHYYFSYLADYRRDRQPGVAHADDIAFVFRTLDADIETVSDRDREVSRIVSAYWVQFATSGDPNGPGLVTWPAYTEQTPRVLELGDELLVHDDLLSERMDFHIQRGTSLLNRAGR